jgi:hypothetical protein
VVMAEVALEDAILVSVWNMVWSIGHWLSAPLH